MLAGSAVVFGGAMALILRKGSAQHQLAGRLFVVASVSMGPLVAASAWFSPGSISSLGILFVFFMIYLVVSAWATIHRSGSGIAPLEVIAPFVALGISMAGLILGYAAISRLGLAEGSPPNEAYFFFAGLAFVAMLLDINNIKVGGVRGKHRIVRHVWRMGCAMFFATASLFTGPGSIVFPDGVKGNPVLSIPETLVVIVSIFWIYRLLFLKRKSLPENASAVRSLQNSITARKKIDGYQGGATGVDDLPALKL